MMKKLVMLIGLVSFLGSTQVTWFYTHAHIILLAEQQPVGR